MAQHLVLEKEILLPSVSMKFKIFSMRGFCFVLKKIRTPGKGQPVPFVAFEGRGPQTRGARALGRRLRLGLGLVRGVALGDLQ